MITGEGDDVQVIITELSWLTHLSIKSNKVDHPINSDMELVIFPQKGRINELRTPTALGRKLYARDRRGLPVKMLD